MGRARVGYVLVPGPDAHPDAERDRPDRGQVLGNDPKAAGKDSATDTWDWFGSHLLVVPAGTVPGPALSVPVAIAAPVAAAVTVTAVAGPVPGTTGLPRALRARIAARQVLAGRLALHHLDRDKRQLAAVVHLADLDLDLVADVHHVVDVLDPLAAVQLADLGDVQQAVLARQQRHERAERGGLHHRAEEALPDLGHVRVGDGVDRGPGRLGRRAVRGPDVDGAIVLDGDLGAGVVLDRVDHLALRADDLADLI